MPVKALDAMPKVRYWHRCRKVSPNVWLPPQEYTPPPSSHSELFQRRTVSTLTDASRNQRNSWKSGKQLMAVFRVIYSGKPQHNAWTSALKTLNGNMSVKHFVGGVLAHVPKHTAGNMETCRGQKSFFNVCLVLIGAETLPSCLHETFDLTAHAYCTHGPHNVLTLPRRCGLVAP